MEGCAACRPSAAGKNKHTGNQIEWAVTRIAEALGIAELGIAELANGGTWWRDPYLSRCCPDLRSGIRCKKPQKQPIWLVIAVFFDNRSTAFNRQPQAHAFFLPRNRLRLAVKRSSVTPWQKPFFPVDPASPIIQFVPPRLTFEERE